MLQHPCYLCSPMNASCRLPYRRLDLSVATSMCNTVNSLWRNPIVFAAAPFRWSITALGYLRRGPVGCKHDGDPSSDDFPDDVSTDRLPNFLPPSIPPVGRATPSIADNISEHGSAPRPSFVFFMLLLGHNRDPVVLQLLVDFVTGLYQHGTPSRRPGLYPIPPLSHPIVRE